MKEIQVTIQGISGLHARPAAIFAQKASSFKSKVTISANNKTADAKSVLGVMGINAAQGTIVHISVDGPDEAECIVALKAVVDSIH